MSNSEIRARVRVAPWSATLSFRELYERSATSDRLRREALCQAPARPEPPPADGRMRSRPPPPPPPARPTRPSTPPPPIRIPDASEIGLVPDDLCDEPDDADRATAVTIAARRPSRIGILLDQGIDELARAFGAQARADAMRELRSVRFAAMLGIARLLRLAACFFEVHA